MYEIKPVKEVYSYFKQNKIEQKFVPLKKKKKIGPKHTESIQVKVMNEMVKLLIRWFYPYKT